MQEPVLTVDDVMKMVKRLMEFPFPQICRHAVALDLISALEQKGYKPSKKLVRAISRAEDDIALAELD